MSTTLARPADATTEAAMQKTLKDAAALAGALYFHDNDSRKNDAGFPDTVIVTRDGRLLAFELKTMKGRVSQAQWDWLVGFASAGIMACVVRPQFTQDAMSLQAAVDLIAGGAMTGETTP